MNKEDAKVAIVIILTGASKEEALQKLEENEAFVRKTINLIESKVHKAYYENKNTMRG